MRNYHYSERNDSGAIVLSDYSKREADKHLKSIVKYPDDWVFEFSERLE